MSIIHIQESNPKFKNQRLKPMVNMHLSKAQSKCIYTKLKPPCNYSIIIPKFDCLIPKSKEHISQTKGIYVSKYKIQPNYKNNASYNLKIQDLK